MSRRFRRALSWSCALLGALSLFTQACGESPAAADRVFQPLEFPFANPAAIVRMSSFGIPNWSGTQPHNGMDFVIDQRLESTLILSPAAGEVVSVTDSENPYSHPPGKMLIGVNIRVNPEWTVALALEPDTADPALKARQLAAVKVRVGQEVAVGTPVADLFVGSADYPHLHYMVMRGRSNVCAYDHSSAVARGIIETIASYPDGNVPGGRICVLPEFPAGAAHPGR